MDDTYGGIKYVKIVKYYGSAQVWVNLKEKFKKKSAYLEGNSEELGQADSFRLLLR